MNGYNFTERTRKVLALAREEAWRLGHDHVAEEHMMLGLLREGEGVAAAVLQNLGADLDEISTRLRERMLARPTSGGPVMDLPYTSRAKKVLELSMREARELNHSYVGTEHLLLGLLRVEGTIVKDVLEKELHLTLEHARAETLRLLGVAVTDGEPSTHFRSVNDTVLEIDIRVQYPDGRVVEHRCRGRFDALRTIASL